MLGFGKEYSEEYANEAYEYYRRIGFSNEQSFVLSRVTYDNEQVKQAIEVYNNSKDKHDGLTFCESISKFAEEIGADDLQYNTLDKYIDKHSPRSNINTNSRGTVRIEHASYGGFAEPMSYSCNTDSLDESCEMDVDEFCEVDYEQTCMCEDSCDYSFNDSFMCCEQSEDEFSGPVALSATGGFGTGGFGGSPRLSSAKASTPVGFTNSAIGNTRGSSKNVLKELMKSIRTDKYEHIEEKGFKNVLNNPTSTFRTTCNNASLDIVSSNMEQDITIDKSMVRTEELLNYFNYNLSNETNEKFTIHAELTDKPNSKNKLLFVGVKGNEIIPKRQNVVILLDVSGSMDDEEHHVQAAVMTLVSKLNKGDKLSLITYSSYDTVVIDDITINENSLDYIIEKFLKVTIFGGTWGSRGLESAYTAIEKNKIEDGINRVVIITDGDFNFGDCSTDSVEKLILEKKKTGAYLSVIGTGLVNTNDELMNTLAKNGNGNYCYIKSIKQVDENINNKYNSLMFSIAKDVKAQVEFNPKYVKSYRLAGYENREISHEDFKNDKVIAEPFGSGAQAIAVYEIEMADLPKENQSGLKYQRTVVVDSDNLCTISIRYKELEDTESKEISKDIEYKIDEMSYNSKIAYIVYITSEKLRNSSFLSEEDIDTSKIMLNNLLIETKSKDYKLGLLSELLK